MREAKLQPSLLLVDDSPLQINLLKDIFGHAYRLYTASNGKEAMECLDRHKIDVIVSDIVMPKVDGIELYRRLKAAPATSEIPVIFITSVADIDAKVSLLELGAFDYITKPFDAREVKARIDSHMKRISRQRRLEEDIKRLNRRLNKQLHEVDSIYNLFYGTIVNIALAKSKETGLHLVRTKYYLAELLKKFLKIHRIPPSIEEKDEDAIIDHMMQAATMHDIGKVGIPDHILMKPGKLTKEEYEIMKKHTVIGYEMLSSEEISINNTVLKYAKQITRAHHERWDGSGYPDALLKEEIPFPARIMAIADVYDALVSKRVYKGPISHEEAVKIIYKDAGKSFDPMLVDIFLNEHKTFRNIAKEYCDKE